jgi:hypothetical protein
MNFQAFARRPAALAALTLASLLSACGGGGEDANVQTADAGPHATILKGGVSPAPTPAPAPAPSPASPLPTTAPAPGILVRESFGLGPNVVRPFGGKGDLKPSGVHTAINSMWAEWPGSKSTAWIASDVGQTWRLCATAPSPYELPSPLQDVALGTAGCVVSDWALGEPSVLHPTALLPFTAPASAWAVSMEGYPSVVAGAYVAIGLTTSALAYSNLETVGQVWLSLRKQEVMVNGPLVYELRLNGRSGELLATGVIDDLTWNQMSIRYDPVAQVMSASLNGQSLGSFPVKLATPKYLGFEGIGILDNFVVRSTANAAL